MIKKDLQIYKRKQAKANRKLLKIILIADAMLRGKDDNYLLFPVCIDENCPKAEWKYVSLLTEEALSGLAEDNKSYLFDNLHIGILVNTVATWVRNSNMKVKSYWETYIAALDGKKSVKLCKYDLSDEEDMVKITNHITMVIASIRDLETLMLTLKPERREIAMNLLSHLFDG